MLTPAEPTGWGVPMHPALPAPHFLLALVKPTEEGSHQLRARLSERPARPDEKGPIPEKRQRISYTAVRIPL